MWTEARMGEHLQAEALHRQFLTKKQVLEVKSKQAVQETYGNAAKVVDEKTAALLFGQSEKYVEYNAQVFPMLVVLPSCLLCARQLGRLFLSVVACDQLLGIRQELPPLFVRAGMSVTSWR